MNNKAVCPSCGNENKCGMAALDAESNLSQVRCWCLPEGGFDLDSVNAESVSGAQHLSCYCNQCLKDKKVVEGNSVITE
ncbi:hypothetical protein A3715_06260 [Oleiphilus sp. HI0009]|uniref:cysteine-rich CWC family protein n=1 Tax=unclassified Oleiphilus TaxID=2631174 RepID=UPI0007C24AF2|nr:MULTISPECIES: cysteine-rich CWC family protein [unclassified Oleiphilus]KZX82117.1 hypothetical protein A3715_06260 [Oleiphilus sp. HI0009]KZY66361.1 hypothetical protein A3738_06680 [Oleiphilus sp. HI0066]MCH2157850.1 cysteine-rich CWC family protein [Oleiphilaceae bacterium]